MVNKETLTALGFTPAPSNFAILEYMERGKLQFAKRKDLKKWRCYISGAWHDVTTEDQVNFLIQITKE